MSSIRPLSVALIAGAALTAGCDPSASPSPSNARDSLGIQIVESREALWVDGSPWQLDPIPTVVIGREDGADPYRFSRIQGVVRGTDGGLVVLDGGSSELRWFNADGVHVRSTGSRGQGPGQFQSSVLSLVEVGDSLLVFDGGLYRISVFRRDGSLIASRRVAPVGDPAPPLRLYSLAGIAPSVGYILRASGAEANIRETPMVFWDSLPNLLYSFDGSTVLDTIGFSGTDISTTGRSASFAPWGTASSAYVHEGRFYLSRGNVYQVDVYGSTGRLERIVRREVDAVPAAEAEQRLFAVIDSFASTQGIPRDAVEEARAQILERPRAMTLPAVRSLAVDALGYLWVERYRARYANFDDLLENGPHEWDVFDPAGQWLGAVQLPKGLRVHAIGVDYVLGVWRNELEVEHVHIYSLRRQ